MSLCTVLIVNVLFVNEGIRFGFNSYMKENIRGITPDNEQWGHPYFILKTKNTFNSDMICQA